MSEVVSARTLVAVTPTPPDPIGLELFRLSESIIFNPRTDHLRNRPDDAVSPFEVEVVMREDDIKVGASLSRTRRFGTVIKELAIAMQGQDEYGQERSMAVLAMKRDHLPFYDFEGDPFVGIFVDSLRRQLKPRHRRTLAS